MCKKDVNDLHKHLTDEHTQIDTDKNKTVEVNSDNHRIQACTICGKMVGNLKEHMGLAHKPDKDLDELLISEDESTDEIESHDPVIEMEEFLEAQGIETNEIQQVELEEVDIQKELEPIEIQQALEPIENRQHLEQIQRAEFVLPNTCDKCNKTFSSEGYLKRHMRTNKCSNKK